MRSLPPIIKTALTLFLLICIPLFDWYFNQGVTGITILLTLLVCVGSYIRLICWRRRRQDEALRDAALRRSARAAGFEEFIKNQKGEVGFREFFWFGLAVLVVGLVLVMVLFPGRCAAADDFVHVDEVLVSASEELYPKTPMRGSELSEVQAATLSLGMLSKMLSTTPSAMPGEVRERRMAAKRLVDRAIENLTELQIMQAGAVVSATRKWGAK